MKVSVEAQVAPLADGEPGSLEAVLVGTGIVALTASSKAASQQSALQALGSAAGDLTPLRRALLRDLAVQALKRGGFESPAKLVDAALPRTAAADATTATGSDLLVGSPQAWPEPVDGGALIADLEPAIA